MRCLVCDGEMRFHFAKTFPSYGLGQVDYWCCAACGFCASKTHLDLPDEAWRRLNDAYHRTYQQQDSNPDDPRWMARIAEQARVLDDAAALGLVTRGRWIDYAAGGGQLSRLLAERGRTLLNFDAFLPAASGYLGAADLRPGSFDLVVTTSVLEHLRRREQLDALEALVAPAGVFALHTVVVEEVPRDPAWFYLLPVHCAFHTNRSMEVLFRRWGYTASVYSVEARLWLWFRGALAERAGAIAAEANGREGKPRYLFKAGFVDYWKGA